MTFSTGHRCLFDLRFRAPEVDDGFLPRNKPGDRVILYTDDRDPRVSLWWYVLGAFVAWLTIVSLDLIVALKS